MTKLPGNSRQASDIDVGIGKRIRARRIEQKLSQANLGDAIGVSFQQVQKYEKGTNRVAPNMLTAIGKALDIPTWQLFAEPGNVEPEAYSTGLNFLATPAGAKIARAFEFIDDKRRTAISNFVLQMAGIEPAQAAE